MSLQTPERLHYRGKDMSMSTCPLRDYFALGGFNPGFHSFVSSILRRGYVGQWQIIENRLYLVELRGTLADGSDATLETVFPGFPDRVFAHWFSGTICLPVGRFTHYQCTGTGIIFSPELRLEFVMGLLVNTARCDGSNRNADDSMAASGLMV